MAKPKKEQANIVEMGGNIGPIMEDIANARDRIIELEKERKAINDEITAIRADLEAKGLPKKAQAAALAYFKLDADQRKGFDEGYLLLREGMGLPMKGAQLDLALEQAKKENDAQKEEAA